MAEFNSCAKLVNEESYNELSVMFENSKDPLQDMLDMQYKLQEQLVKKLPFKNIDPKKIETKGEMINWLDRNFDCIMDEFRELKNAVGGISNGEKAASSVWKPWKANHENIINEKISDMSESDKLEMLFEIIDIQHFYMNMLIGLGLSSKDIYVLYMLKNLENARRYSSGY